MIGEFALAALMKRLRETPTLSRQEAKTRFNAALFELMSQRSANDTYLVPPLVKEVLNATRAELRATDNDLERQIATIRDSLDDWFTTGQLPPAYPAWRIAVILRKAGRKREEAAFLSVWCRHFGLEQSLGFPALTERNHKLRL